MCRARKRLTLQAKFGLEFYCDAFLLHTIPIDKFSLTSNVRAAMSLGFTRFFPSKLAQNKIAAYPLHINVN